MSSVMLLSSYVYISVVHCCVCLVIVMMIVMTTMMTMMMMMMMMAEMTDDRQVYMNLSTEEESLYAEIDHHDERET